MAIGKNKKLGKKGKTAGRRKPVDPFTKKEWYEIKAPGIFSKRLVGLTPVTRTTGTKIATEVIKGRVITTSLADLSKDKSEDVAFRKIKLIGEEVSGTELLTNFYGMDMTRDKLNSLIRKKQSIIEAFVDVKTTDGYHLRLFCIGFTKRTTDTQQRSITGFPVTKAAYPKASHVRAIRKLMVDTMTAEATSTDLKGLVKKFVAESIGNKIQSASAKIFPIQDVFIRKVKTIKAPRFDITRLMEIHAETGADVGKSVKDAELTIAPTATAGGRY